MAGTGQAGRQWVVCPAKGLYQYAELIEGLICVLIEFYFFFQIEFFIMNE